MPTPVSGPVVVVAAAVEAEWFTPCAGEAAVLPAPFDGLVGVDEVCEGPGNRVGR